MAESEPLHEDSARCLRLRKQSKQGVRLSREDSAFCEQMFREHPTWYEKTDIEVWNDTLPPGSNAYREPPTLEGDAS